MPKIYEKLIASRLSRYFEASGVFPQHQFAYRKGLGTCDALLTVSHHLQMALEKNWEARLVQLDFSAAFDRVSHPGLVYKLQAAGVGGHLLSVQRNFLAERTMRVVLVGCASPCVDVVSGVPQGSVIGPLLFVVYTRDLFDVVENMMFNYADDSTLVAVI